MHEHSQKYEWTNLGGINMSRDRALGTRWVRWGIHGAPLQVKT